MKTVLLTFVLALMATAHAGEPIAGKMVTGGFTTADTPNNTLPLAISAGDCQYLAEGVFDKNTKRSTIRLIKKTCPNELATMQGWVLDDKKEFGIAGQHIKAGTAVYILEN